MTRKRAVVLAVGLLVLGAASFVPVGGERIAEGRSARRALRTMDLTSFADAKVAAKLRLLFIHHSCGGQLLAPPGPDDGENCLYRTHPNGGGLRPLLEDGGYEVHEASYRSLIGDRTDLFDWLPKFRTQMDRILTTARQDERLPGGQKNQIVVFKSCFPNSAFVAEGQAPGNASGPALTVWNARATMAALRDELARHPDVLFVYVTAPPLAPVVPRQPAWKWLAKTVLGKQPSAESLRQSGDLARRFNDWMVDTNGWLAGYREHNVVVFDYYRVLTGERSNLLAYPTGPDGSDSHPSADGNRRAARLFVPFLNRAVRRAGLSD
jgi:hypothetical protein